MVGSGKQEPGDVVGSRTLVVVVRTTLSPQPL